LVAARRKVEAARRKVEAARRKVEAARRKPSGMRLVCFFDSSFTGGLAPCRFNAPPAASMANLNKSLGNGCRQLLAPDVAPRRI
jgi:hypothetical protein